jgi:hypothetical protein
MVDVSIGLCTPKHRSMVALRKGSLVAALMEPGANATEVPKQAGVDRSLLYIVGDSSLRLRKMVFPLSFLRQWLPWRQSRRRRSPRGRRSRLPSAQRSRKPRQPVSIGGRRLPPAESSSNATPNHLPFFSGRRRTYILIIPRFSSEASRQGGAQAQQSSVLCWRIRISAALNHRK